MRQSMSHARILGIALAVLFAAQLVLLPESAAAEEKPHTLAELREERREMAHRKRRIIFNNDGDDYEGHGGPNNDRTEQSAALTATTR